MVANATEVAETGMTLQSMLPEHVAMNDVLEANDWVICARKLVSVVRVGYGMYGGKVRILHPHENDCEWSAGQWVPHCNVIKQRLPAQCRTIREALSADDPAIHIPDQSVQGASLNRLTKMGTS